jgi:hypothetical protein
MEVELVFFYMRIQNIIDEAHSKLDELHGLTNVELEVRIKIISAVKMDSEEFLLS